MTEKKDSRRSSSSGSSVRGPRGTRIERASDIKGTLIRLTGYLLPYRLHLAGVLLLVIASTGLDLLGPFLMGIAIDRYMAAADQAGLATIALIMLGTYALTWLAQVGQNALMAIVSQRALRVMRQDLFEHLQTLSLAFFDRHPHGELMSRLTNDIDAINRVMAMNIIALFSGILTLAGIIIMMFALNLWLALGSMIVFPFMLWVTGYVGRRTRHYFRRYQEQLGAMNGRLEETYSGQRVIAAFGQQNQVLDEFEQVNDEVRRVGIQAESYGMLVPPLMGVLSSANIAIVAGLGGWMTLQGLATVGTIAAFISYSRHFAGPLRQLGDLYNQVQSAIAGAERVFEMIDREAEIQDAPDAKAVDRIEGHIEFRDVRFSYVPGVPVINNMSLEAQPGQTIALVGPTGAGKTTIVNLLTRFYEIDEGVIRVDGHDLRDIRIANLRRQLGIVLQDTFLFSEPVMDNIRYGRLDATDQEVIDAARLANADQFIRRLPQEYDTPLSERAENLSQGQRQLLAIARAVLADPRILILDEATSSVDTRTEIQIQQALLNLMQGRTSFVIAHRLSTIRDADNVLVIDDGKIVEQGTHKELLAREGAYYAMYTAQFRRDPVPES